MGVQGLLQKVKSVVQQVHLSDFEGQTLAIDGASWLHKGVLSCAAELERGETTEAFLNYPLAMVETMRSHGVTPLMVFDGGILLAKSAMHRQRAETRTRNRQMAADLDGTEGAERRIDAALRKAVGVTPEITRRLITELRARGVHYLVAPYEADPQLAFLVREGYASAAVSEDSDMLPYGCARVLFKLSRETARADLIELDDLQAVEENGTHLFDGAWDGEWPAWREGLLRSMCVLAGTDYLASLPQVGIVKAHAAVRKHRQLHAAACELARAQRLDPAAVQEYARRAEMAQLVFSHQLVYDPATECVWPLSPLPPGMMLPQSEMEELFGRMLEPALARSICREATVNPINHRPYDLPPSPPIAMLLRPAPPLAGGLARRDGAAATAVARALAGSAAGEAAWPSGPSGAAVAGAAAGAVAGAVAGASAWPGLARVGVGVARVGVTPNVAAAAAVVAAARAASAAAGSGAVGVAAAAVVGARGAAENALCSDSTWEAMKLGGGVNAAHAVNAISGPHAPAFNSAGMGAGVLLAEAAHAVSAKRPREDCDRVEARVLQAPGFVLVGCAGRAGEDVWGGGERGVGEEIIPSEDAHGLVVTGGEGCNTGRGGDARLSKACSSAANGLRGGGAGGAGVSSERGSAPDMSQGREVSSKGSDAPWPDGFGGVAGGPNLWWAVAEWAAATGEHRLLQVLSRDCDDSLLAGGTPTGAQLLHITHASLSHWAFSKGGVNGAPAPPLLVRATLSLLDLLRAYLPQPSDDDQLTPSFSRALLATWRQALLQPLREQPPAWDTLDHLLRSLPDDAAALLSEVQPLRPTHQAAGAACHRAVSLYSAEHPRTELVTALAELLPLSASVLPPASLLSVDVSRSPRPTAATHRPDRREEVGEQGGGAAASPQRRTETEASDGAGRQPARTWRADDCHVVLGACDVLRDCQ